MAITDSPSGLSHADLRLLQEIAATGSWKQAAENLGLTPRQVRYKLKDPAFKAEYDKQFDTEELQHTRRELDLIAGNAARLYEEAVNAELSKKIPAECPACGEKFSVFAKVIDYATRLRVADTLMKISGVWKDQKSLKVEGNVGVTHIHLTAGEMLALSRLNMGLSVPEHIYRRLEELAQSGAFSLPALPAAPIVEGEFHEASADSE